MRDTVRIPGFVLVAAAIVSVGASAETASDGIFSSLAGEWGSQEQTCESNPHVISFSEDRSFALFTYRIPPEISRKWAGLAIERQSPEYSAGNTIRFEVLDYGDRWIALRRVGEEKLDRLGKPITWKLSLAKDKNGYRWQPFGAVGWKKSILRGVRCSTTE